MNDPCIHEPLTKLKHLQVTSLPMFSTGQIWSAPVQVCSSCGVVYVEKEILEEAKGMKTDD